MLDVARPVDVAAQTDVPHLMTSHSQQLRDNTIRRGHTILGVTAEAGAVFEHLLRRSHSDSAPGTASSSHSGRQRAGGPQGARRRPLTAIAETTDSAPADIGGGHRTTDVSTDNDWATDGTLDDAVDTRLSSFDGLDEEVRPSWSSVQSGGDKFQYSQDLIDVFETHRFTRTRLSSDGLEDLRPQDSTQQSNGPRYFEHQSSRDSGDLLGSGGRRTTEALSLGSMSADFTDDVDVDDADDERRKQKQTPKKKKSVFKRVRERLRVTFGRNPDRHQVAHKADKYMHPADDVETRRQNWLSASFSRRRKKQRQTDQDHVVENGSTSAASNRAISSSVNSNNTVDQHSSGRDQQNSKGFLSSLQRRFSSIRIKRSHSSHSHGSGMSF